jgi:hypothetical protein
LRVEFERRLRRFRRLIDVGIRQEWVNIKGLTYT